MIARALETAHLIRYRNEAISVTNENDTVVTVLHFVYTLLSLFDRTVKYVKNFFPRGNEKKRRIEMFPLIALRVFFWPFVTF